MSEHWLFGKLFGQRGQGGKRGTEEAPPSAPRSSDAYFTYDRQQDSSHAKEEELQAMDDLLSSITAMELPDALDVIMLGPNEMDDSQPGAGFARYAARLFSEVGASRIRDIAVAHELSVIRLSGTGAFWMRMPYHDLSYDELSCALAAESAMNRLLFIRGIFAAQDQVSSWREDECHKADTTLINSIERVAAEALKGLPDNPLAELFGVGSKRGGEWDVRTRFALVVEQLHVPFRLAYAFDCSVKEGLFRIDYSVPLSEWLPQHCYDPEAGRWADMSKEASVLADKYALSLGVVLAAAAFGTSVGITRVHLVSHPCDLRRPESHSFEIDRISFVSDVVPRITAGEPSWLGILVDAFTDGESSIDSILQANHFSVPHDTRPLPPELRDMLRADTVAELDVISDLPTDSWDSVHAAENDREDAPLAAIAVLEDVASQGEAALASLPPNAVPLYCSDAVSRFLVQLAPGDSNVRYARYSDAAFRARSVLCDLYCDLGEPDRAAMQATQCVELAPTSTIGYTDLVNALFNKQDYESALPHLEAALALATNEPTIAFLYYRLAYALWQTGKRETALACYVMCTYHGFSRPEVVVSEMDELVSEMATLAGGNRPQVPTVSAAHEMLQRDGIALAPTQQVRTLLASALIKLVDEGFLDAAAPLARMMATAVSYRDELFVVASSLER